MTTLITARWELRPLFPRSLLVLLFTLPWLSGCGVNNIPTYDEQAKAAWAQVENQYQRRADLVPNLVATVKGYATHEQETLIAVTEARAKVGSIQAGKDLLDNPQKLQQFQAAQSELGSALQRLMVVVERYPDLKANSNMMQLNEELAKIRVSNRRLSSQLEAHRAHCRLKEPQG